MARKPSRQRIPRPLLARWAAIGAVAVALMAVSFNLFTSEALARRNPEAALRLWSNHPVALVEAANEQVFSPVATGTQGTEAAARARRALRLGPATRGAFAVLAALDPVGPDSSERLAFDEAQSRRYLPTQLLLMESASRAGDLERALHHYDVALRTSPQAAGELLLPVLTAAAAEHRLVARKVASRLAANPPWTTAFLDYATSTAPSPDGALAIEEALHRQGLTIPRQQFRYLLSRLEGDRKYSDAFTLYQRYVGTEGRLAIRNGRFEREDLYPPIDWVLANEAEKGAERVVAGDGSSLALMLRADEGAGGEVARQLLALPAGRPFTFSLAAQGVAMEGDPPVVRVVCATSRAVLAEIALSAAGRATAAGRAPPGDCRYQWLIVVVRDTPLPDELTIDDVRIDTGRSNGTGVDAR